MLFWFQLVIGQCFGTLATFSSLLLLLLFFNDGEIFSRLVPLDLPLLSKPWMHGPGHKNLALANPGLDARTLTEHTPSPTNQANSLQAPIPLICAVMVYIKIKIKGIVSGWLWGWRMPASMVYINLVCKYTVHITYHCTI